MKLIKLFGLVAVAASFSSCNTLVGIGRDIKQFGGGIESKGQGDSYKEGASTQKPN